MGTLVISKVYIFNESVKEQVEKTRLGIFVFFKSYGESNSLFFRNLLPRQQHEIEIFRLRIRRLIGQSLLTLYQISTQRNFLDPRDGFSVIRYRGPYNPLTDWLLNYVCLFDHHPRSFDVNEDFGIKKRSIGSLAILYGLIPNGAQRSATENNKHPGETDINFVPNILALAAVDDDVPWFTFGCWIAAFFIVWPGGWLIIKQRSGRYFLIAFSVLVDSYGTAGGVIGCLPWY